MNHHGRKNSMQQQRVFMKRRHSVSGSPFISRKVALPRRKLSVVEEDDGCVFQARKARPSIPDNSEAVKLKAAQDMKKEPKKSKIPRLQILGKPSNLKAVGKQEREKIISPIPLPEGVECIDPVENNGMFLYWQEFIVYAKRKEKKFVFQPKTITSCNDGIEDNRPKLMNWILEVCLYLKVSQETLYHTVRMIDTILSKRQVPSDKIQLLAVTCLLIAAKLEEYYPPSIEELLRLTEDSYSRSELIKLEMKLLNVLEGETYAPEPMLFLNRYIQAALKEDDSLFFHTCQFLVDVLIPDITYSSYASSEKAAAAVFVALHVFGEDTDEKWTPTLSYYTGYRVLDLISLSKVLLSGFKDCLQSAIKKDTPESLSGVMRKFKSTSRHECVLTKLAGEYGKIERLVLP